MTLEVQNVAVLEALSTKTKVQIFTATTTTSSVPKAFTASSLKRNTILKKKGEE